METNAVIETLRTIYNLHSQLNDINYRLNRGPQILALHKRKVEDRQNAANEAEQALKATKLATEKKQLQLDASEQQVKKRESQLMECKSNVEYKGLQNEIAAQKMAMSVLSDEILEALDKAEALNQKLVETQKEVETVQKDFETFKEDMEAKRPGMITFRDQVMENLAQVEKKLPAEFRDLYHRACRDTMARDGQYTVLAPVKDGYCQHCNKQLVANRLTGLAVGKFTVCNSCGCILFLPEHYEIQSIKGKKPS